MCVITSAYITSILVTHMTAVYVEFNDYIDSIYHYFIFRRYRLSYVSDIISVNNAFINIVNVYQSFITG